MKISRHWLVGLFILVSYMASAVEDDPGEAKVIDTQWGKVIIDVKDKEVPEPASATSWLEVSIQCKNGVKATVRESVCDSAFDHTVKKNALEIKYFLLDPEATGEVDEEICDEENPLLFKIDLRDACRKKSKK